MRRNGPKSVELLFWGRQQPPVNRLTLPRNDSSQSMTTRLAPDTARTKIVATLGPACCDEATIRELISAGADVFRLNMAHGKLEEHERMIQAIRQAEEDHPVAILVDLAGPKLRLGQLVQDPLDLSVHRQVRIVRSQKSTSPTDLVSSYPDLVDKLEVDDEILLADGTILLVVTEKSDEALTCHVIRAGILRSRQGINIPGALRGVPAMTDADRACVRWAASQSIDFVSLSFVQSSQDIVELRHCMKESGFRVPVIAKIEKRDALDSLESIIQTADGVMVARGDLGIEIDVALVPVTQKQIIKLANAYQKPVIVATEMLDSMQRSPRPTRAEATDVANAVLDGADACMLSGETAVGKFPIEAVRTMNRIMLTTEEEAKDLPARKRARKDNTKSLPISQAVVIGADCIARQLDAQLVVISTRSGITAQTKSSQRDFVPTVAVSADVVTLRRTAIYWGIRPIPNAPYDNVSELRAFIFDWGMRNGTLSSGDYVVFVCGRDTDQRAHNSVAVHAVP